MKTSHNLKLLDTVALLRDDEAHGVVHGQVGVVVERLNENTFEVEFADTNGRTISIFAVSADDLILLHHDAVKA